MKNNVCLFCAICISALWSLTSSIALADSTDDYVVELYETYCSACHSTEGTGAPIAFNVGDWKKGLSSGVDELANKAITGVGNMPAQGGCMECEYEDFVDLVNYMSQAKPE